MSEAASIRCVVHIGGPKCGSSALQYALSADPEPTATIRDLAGFAGERPAYCAISDGGLVRGASLIQRATHSPHQAVVSALPQQLMTLNDGSVRAIRAELLEIVEQGRVPVLSQEAYLEGNSRVRQSGFFERLGIEVTALAYVRPPLSFINSAWGQWGRWQDQTFEKFLRWSINVASWSIHLRSWRTIPGVERVEVRLVPDDVVADFLSIDVTENRRNTALSGAVVRSLVEVGHLRRVHQSDLDEAFRRWSAGSLGEAPWVLDRSTMQRILAETREASTELLGMLRPDDADRARQDREWWQASDREFEPPNRRASYEDLLEAFEVTARALLNADRRVRRLTGTAVEAAITQARQAAPPD